MLAVMFSGFRTGYFVTASVSDLFRSLNFMLFNADFFGFFSQWIVAVVAGFLQWFVLVPMAFKYLQAFASKHRRVRME